MVLTKAYIWCVHVHITKFFEIMKFWLFFHSQFWAVWISHQIIRNYQKTKLYDFIIAQNKKIKRQKGNRRRKSFATMMIECVRACVHAYVRTSVWISVIELRLVERTYVFFVHLSPAPFHSHHTHNIDATQRQKIKNSHTRQWHKA